QAYVLAQEAADARLGIHQLGDAAEGAGVIGNGQALEGTNVDAVGAAGAVDFQDDGLGPFVAADAGCLGAFVIDNATGRPYPAAHAAVDADVGVDAVDDIAVTGNAVHRTDVDTCRTADASLGNAVGQKHHPLPATHRIIACRQRSCVAALGRGPPAHRGECF